MLQDSSFPASETFTENNINVRILKPIKIHTMLQDSIFPEIETFTQNNIHIGCLKSFEKTHHVTK